MALSAAGDLSSNCHRGPFACSGQRLFKRIVGEIRPLHSLTPGTGGAASRSMSEMAIYRQSRSSTKRASGKREKEVLCGLLANRKRSGLRSRYAGNWDRVFCRVTYALRVADALSDWRKQCAYTKPDDWVFASRRYRGRRPRDNWTGTSSRPRGGRSICVVSATSAAMAKLTPPSN